MSRLPLRLLRPASARYHPPTRDSPASVPAYQDKSVPSPPSPVITRFRLFLPSLSLTTPSRFPSPPIPRCFRNLFYRGLQLPFHGCLTPSLLTRPPPALEPCLFCTNLKYWSQGDPLCYCFLPPLDVFPKRFCPCRLDHPLIINVSMESSLDMAGLRVKVDNDLVLIGISHE